MTRERANYLIENLRIRFGEKELGLLDLVTASYFTEGEEYPYGVIRGKQNQLLNLLQKLLSLVNYSAQEMAIDILELLFVEKKLFLEVKQNFRN